jgi:hypothetical protein
MTARTFLAAIATLLGLVSAAPGQAAPQVAKPRVTPAAAAAALLSGRSPDALAGSLRGLLIKSLPPTLYEASPGWGQTAPVAHGLKWHGKGLPLRPEITYGLKKHGTWQHILVTAPNLADTLILDLRDVQEVEPGRVRFRVFVAFDAHVDYCRQRWESGLKLYDGSVRARMRVQLRLQCEALSRLDAKGGVVPDIVLRLHLTESALSYDNRVFEHVAGVGGEMAKLLGDAVHGGLRQWHPSLERALLTKAEAALVKAGDTGEIRLSLANLFKKR